MWLTRADSIRDYSKPVEGRIAALARVHTILSDLSKPGWLDSIMFDPAGDRLSDLGS